MSDFWSDLRLLPYFMCANSEGSVETSRMRRLALAFASRLCDKYHNLMSWFILRYDVKYTRNPFLNIKCGVGLLGNLKDFVRGKPDKK